MSSPLSLQEENRILQQELSRVEDLLAQSRAERDELAIKYNAISERVSRPRGTPKTTWFNPKIRAVQTITFPFPTLGKGDAAARPSLLAMGIWVPWPDPSQIARLCPAGCTNIPPHFIYPEAGPPTLRTSFPCAGA